MSRSTAGSHLPRPFPAHALHPGVRCGPGDDPVLHPVRQSKAAQVAAEKLCAPCPVRDECLAWALEHSPRIGYYAGVSPSERRKVAV